MVEGRFGHLPVVEDGKLVGMVTRRDIVPTRMRQLELERLQPRWSPRPRLNWRPPWSSPPAEAADPAGEGAPGAEVPMPKQRRDQPNEPFPQNKDRR